MTASGIHAHPRYKTGRRKPKNAPAIRLADILTGVLPSVPVTVDHFGKIVFGLDGNDKYGVCGPTSVDNLMRLVSTGLLGYTVSATQAEVYDLYRRSGNPTFDPATGAGDNGVDMQTMLEALLAGGIGATKPVAFAKVNVNSDAELEAAVSIFGGVLWGVNLLTAQQAQTEAHPPRWDYGRSNEWGGHAVVDGAYESGALEDVITWAKRVETTAGFRLHQLEEAWIVIFPWHLAHPAFQQGIDLAALANAYLTLTGKTLPVPVPVPPVPGPSPIATADVHDLALWNGIEPWVEKQHIHGPTTKPIVADLKQWAKAKGLAA